MRSRAFGSRSGPGWSRRSRSARTVQTRPGRARLRDVPSGTAPHRSLRRSATSLQGTAPHRLAQKLGGRFAPRASARVLPSRRRASVAPARTATLRSATSAAGKPPFGCARPSEIAKTPSLVELARYSLPQPSSDDCSAVQRVPSRRRMVCDPDVAARSTMVAGADALGCSAPPPAEVATMRYALPSKRCPEGGGGGARIGVTLTVNRARDTTDPSISSTSACGGDSDVAI